MVLDSVPTSVTLEEYVDATVKQLPGDFHIASRAELRLNGREAVRLVMEFTVQEVKGSQLIYLVKDPSGIWTLVLHECRGSSGRASRVLRRAPPPSTPLPDPARSAAALEAGGRL